MKNRYDVVVVGAGPAGSMAAKSASENGAEVLLLDKRKELGVPVQCGEALSEGALIDLNIEPDPRWAINKIDSTKLIAPSGKVVEISQKSAVKVGYILDRKVFDEDLAVRAVRAGSDIRVDTFVKGLLLEEEGVKGVKFDSHGKTVRIESDIVIAADGVMSKVARWAGLDTSLGPMDIESGTQFKMVGIDIEDQHSMDFYFGSEIAPGGYIWIFPKAEDVANVGVGVLPGLAEKSSIEYLKDFISSRPELSKGKVVEVNVGGVPVSGPIEETVANGLMVVGDAARMVNPMTGGGINFAMRSGNIAGKVAAKCVEEEDFSKDRLMEYEQGWKEEIGGKLEKYTKGKDVLLDLSDDDLDDVADTFQDVDFEEISLTKMLKTLATTNPRLTWKLKDFI
ncbi:MAG: geranylgeranyl reductase family protein [Candidatus Hadarchaeota archaeon]